MSEKNDRYWLDDALHVARKSKDPSTKVGVVIVNPKLCDKGIKISEGYNGFPRGIADTQERLLDRDMKLKLVVHGEINAVMNCARIGISTFGCIMYVVAMDAVTGDVWGGAPCTRCTVECIQAGIVEYVSYPVKRAPSRWHGDCSFAAGLLSEAGLVYREVAFIEPWQSDHKPIKNLEYAQLKILGRIPRCERMIPFGPVHQSQCLFEKGHAGPCACGAVS